MTEEQTIELSEITMELQEVNEKLTPILKDVLETIDAKTAIIYFAGLTKNFLDVLDDESFKKIIIQYITDGD